MTAAVDLSAVRASRRILAAAVADHPELTGPTGPVFYVEHLSEIYDMTRRLDPNATGESTTVGVRLSPQLYSAVDRERVRLAEIVPGSSIGMSDAVRSLILRALAMPAQTTTAAPAAPSPVLAVASPVVPVAAPPVAPSAPVADPRQLPLIAPSAPTIALHNAANGASVATPTGNDNAVAPTAPKRTRRAVPDDVVADTPADAEHARAALVGERLRELRDEEIARGEPGPREWSGRAAALRAGVSSPTIDKLMRGETVRPKMVDKVAAILPAK